MSIGREVEAIIVDVSEVVLDDAQDFNELDKEALFAIALGCFAVARKAAVTALDSDDGARIWFERTIAERWRNPGNPT